MSKGDNYKLWGGCFEEEPSSVLRRLNDSLPTDSRLFREDIQGSSCWAHELHLCGYLNSEDHNSIQNGLIKVEKEISDELGLQGKLSDAEEDIHSVVERRLVAHAGEAALRLHTARSRNDQSATDTKLWMLSAIPRLVNTLCQLIQVITDRGNEEIDIIIPGYTHLQRAQPIRWSHFLLSHAWTLQEDCLRFNEQISRVSRCPLGSGALAGCALPIDRNRLAKSLGFQAITPNSMYAVSSRDHIVEFLNGASLCGIHLSRLAEDLIMYSSQEFGFIGLSDSFSTGSSLMPQKRNPDGLELVRGSACLLMGDAFAFSCTLKGLPSTYNKDLQCDKELLFRSYDKLTECIKVTSGTIFSLKVIPEKALNSLEPNMLATDLAHALVRGGVPFRQAHHIVGSVLKRAQSLGKDLKTLPPAEYFAICPELSPEALNSLFSWEASVEQYTSAGGTARETVREQIHQLRKWLSEQGIKE